MLNSKPKNLGHRGASGYAPENTMAAFRLCMEMGSDGLEFDVQMTKDGVPVVIHDEKLLRTTGAPGTVNQYTWREIQSLDAGLWLDAKWQGERIPALEKVLAEFSGAYLNIEIKNSILPYEGLEEKVIYLIDRHCSPLNVIVSSFNHHSIRRISSIFPHIPTGYLFDKPAELAVETILGTSTAAVHPAFAYLTKESVRDYHQHGFKVNTWTVNSTEDMKQMIDMGVDAIITNYPLRLKEVLEAY
jgi:glycerophosphoryl diester phosphodiesterase